MKFENSVLDNISQNYKKIFAAEKKIADYILNNPEHTVTTNVSMLAKLSGTSDATVIRLCKHLGYKGFYQMKLQLAHDLGKRQIISNDIQQKNPKNIQNLFCEISNNLIQAKANIDNDSAMKCIELICDCNTAHIVAAGNSIPTSVDFAFRLGRIGIRASSAYIVEQHLNMINLGTENDIVIGISHSGSSKQVLQAFELAKKHNMKCIAITDLLHTTLANNADYAIATGIESLNTDVFGTISHIYIVAVLDSLICLVANAKNDSLRNNEEIDDVEFFLSESKE